MLAHALQCTRSPPRPCSLPGAGLHGSILRAGALWLLGVCGTELRTEHWGQAFALVVAHVTHGDVVVSCAPCSCNGSAAIPMAV